MSAELLTRRFTVQDYHRMVDAGILREDDRVELIRGQVVTMSPIGPPHAALVDRALRTMDRAVGDRAIVRVQGSVQLDEYSQPQPDIALLRPRADFYCSAHPLPPDILLVVEVAQSSLGYDRGLKAGLYAEAGIEEYWVVDVTGRRLIAYSDAHNGEYRSVRVLTSEDVLTPKLLPGCSIAVASLLG
jgi:Uma2 family endonuclease